MQALKRGAIFFVTGLALVVVAQSALAGGPYQYFAVTPCRVIDTRNANGPTGGPALVGQAVGRAFPLAGICGVPTTAKAVSLNATTVATTGSGNLRLYPSDLPTMPLVATMNFNLGEPAIANGALVPLAAYNPSTPGDPMTNQSFSAFLAIQTGFTAHMVVDVTGYFQ